ncbi:VOC family protein [Emcibacter sp.]|uniref:VOC family protein n=1 Tax=Emcibacter sp. TaxID=1979954 RepID=UPI002AA62DB7|nr:VOC family protein [Emcibacter sp.]
MAIKVVGIHHHAVRVGDGGEDLDAVHDFYTTVLGMGHDEGRPNIPEVPGWWINVGDGGQIHLIGGAFPSVVAKGPGQDPAAPHVALAVENITEAKEELDRQGVSYFTSSAGETQQIFVHDPCGNMIELHQFDKCRCIAANRGDK